MEGGISEMGTGGRDGEGGLLEFDSKKMAGEGEERGGGGLGRAKEEKTRGSWEEGVVEGRRGDGNGSGRMRVGEPFSFKSTLLKRIETSLFSLGMSEASISLSLI